MKKKNRPGAPIIIICGPTATGKSRIAASLAHNKGEIISADSQQVYKYLDIGTAKPEKELLDKAKHHLIGEVELETDFTAYVMVSVPTNTASISFGFILPLRSAF